MYELYIVYKEIVILISVYNIFVLCLYFFIFNQ